MPFKSKSQEKFMFANHPKIAKEFEAATPNTQLPEHVQKMAFGGETNPRHETVMSMENNHTAGFADGGMVEPEFITKLRDYFLKSGGAAGNDAREVMNASNVEDSSAPVVSTGTAKGYADGGEVDPLSPQADLTKLISQFQAVGNMAPSPAPVPPPQGAPNMGEGPNVGNESNGVGAPDMGTMMKTMQQTPPTDPSIYQGISADQRAALYKQLLDKQNSGGNLVAQAVGGLGDAIGNSFGGQHNKFQDETAGIAAKNTENRVGAMDTQRTQRLADMDAHQQQLMNDPNSQLSAGMRAVLKSQGIPVPSGMNASIMLKVLGPLGELSYKQAMMGMTGLKNQADIQNQQSSRKLEAAKGLESRGILEKAKDAFFPSEETKAMKAQISGSDNNAQSHGIPDLGATFNGGKVINVKRIS